MQRYALISSSVITLRTLPFKPEHRNAYILLLRDRIPGTALVPQQTDYAKESYRLEGFTAVHKTSYVVLTLIHLAHYGSIKLHRIIKPVVSTILTLLTL